MSLFSKPKVVLWPKSNSTDIYLDKSDNNIFSLDVSLWKTCSDIEIQSVNSLFTQQKITNLTILVPDDVIYTKSFVYDTEIKTIDKAEVIGLAESFINFKIDPEYIDYKLIQSSGKTIIQSHIFDKSKIEALKSNLSLLKLESFSFESVSQAISKIISSRYDKEYFLLYPLNQNEFTLLLSQGDSVFLTSNLKGPDLEVQKIVNYSKLYFSSPTTKFYVPQDPSVNIIATSSLDKSPYDQSQMAIDSKKPSNIPLPVLGILVSNPEPPAIINSSNTNSNSTPKMENKKNILPFIIVFIVTAVIASGIIYFVLNRNNTVETNSNNPSTTITPTSEPSPTETPTPTVAEISKKIKIQVLNATDINGQAAVLKEQLTKLGFTSIAVGNSPNKITTNQIKIKAAMSSDSAYFQSNIPAFSDATVSADLKETSSYDVVFSIGTDLGSGGSVSTTPSPVPTE